MGANLTEARLLFSYFRSLLSQRSSRCFWQMCDGSFSRGSSSRFFDIFSGCSPLSLSGHALSSFLNCEMPQSKNRCDDFVTRRFLTCLLLHDYECLKVGRNGTRKHCSSRCTTPEVTTTVCDRKTWFASSRSSGNIRIHLGVHESPNYSPGKLRSKSECLNDFCTLNRY